MSDKSAAVRCLRRYDDISPLDFFFRHKEAAILPEQIAEQFYNDLGSLLPVRDEELFRFAVAELVSNCYFSPVEKIYRTEYENFKDIRDRMGVLQTVHRKKLEKIPLESLRIDIAESGERLSFWILSNVLPERASLERIQERLAWDELSAVEFIHNQSESGGKEYVSMTGAAGFGIYMAKKEFARYGGKLTFVNRPEEGWSGYEVAFTKPIQYRE